MFDTHAHLDQDCFESDRPAVIVRARAAGVAEILLVGCTGATSRRGVEIATGDDQLYASAGIQPNYVTEIETSDWDSVVELANHPKVVALGETGLDRYWDESTLGVQQDYFDRHLRLSQHTGLPFIVHMRNCEQDILDMLREARTRGPLRGVMHSFTGSAQMAGECVELGLYISFAGMVTYKKSQDLRDVAATVPLDRLLVETDSPYLSPEPVRKIRRNEPAHVVHTVACLANVRGLSAKVLAQTTTRNARQLFLRAD
jgi:TatD DNase family protein